MSLTFDSQALAQDVAAGGVPWGAVGPEEIVVTRRLYRDGESEYLLNGVPSRLRDVIEFFLGTGVGSKAYAIIEQGRIGFIVSSRPEDRRGLIDEAAGITKYKAKKKAAERQMDSTRQHLLRVSDIIGEIESRLRSLRLQAQKAERYKRYKARAARHRAVVGGAALSRPPRRGEVAGRRAGELCASATRTSRSALEVEEAAIEAERLAVTEEMNELATAKDDLFALVEQGAAGHAARRAPRRRGGRARRRGRRAARQEIDELRARARRPARCTIEELEAQLVGDRQRRGGEPARSTRRRRRSTRRCARRWRQARRELDAALAEVAAAQRAHRAHEASERRGVQRRDDLAARLAAIATEDAASAERIDGAVGRRSKSCATQPGGAARAARRAARSGGAPRTRGSRAACARVGPRRDGARDAARGGAPAALAARVADGDPGPLRELSEGRARHHAAAARARRRRRAVDGIRGVVADIVQPPPELETAVEAVLGERLGNVIVESHEVGVEAIEFLKRTSEGRSSLHPASGCGRSRGARRGHLRRDVGVGGGDGRRSSVA